MTLPETMKCVEISEAGGPEVLKPAIRPLPEAGPDDVLIRVEAAGVNRPDVAQRAGVYPPPPGASDLPGLEVSGTVAALGANVSGLAIGDRVCALTPGGGYAEFCTAPAAHCLPWPKGYDAVQSAALPENYFTVWHNVFQRGGLASGEKFLVHGGSSGIGTTAIQLAKAMGATVYTTAGSEEKCDACREIGADLAVNYREQDFEDAIRDHAGKGGINVILDMVGGDYFPKNMKLLAVEGRLVIIATLRGPVSEIHLARMMVKRQTVTGSTLRPQSDALKAGIARGLRETAWPLLEDASIRPLIHEIFPLEKAAEAHALMESSSHIGKIMLVPG
jgi:NADPH2:quinone reductase